MPDWKKLIEGKISLAKRGAKPSKASENVRIPAGQKQVNNFPILDLGIKPEIKLDDWRLRVFGLVENEIKLGWAEFQAMPQITDISDFHCVTRWSQLDMDWHCLLYTSRCV